MNDLTGHSRMPQDDLPTESHVDLDYWMNRADALPEVRTEKVDSIRAQLKEGNYDKEELFDEMIRRLSEEMAGLGCD